MANIRYTLPIDQGVQGRAFDREEPDDAVDRLLADWEAPLVWHHQPSFIELDRFFQSRPCLHFAFERRTPEVVWQKGWHLWYDNCLVHRRQFADATITARLGYEELTFGYGGDNQQHVGPWIGIVARMQDLRRYYFLTLEYPDRVVLYRREDAQWTALAAHQVHLDVWTEYELRLEARGQLFRAWLDGAAIFTAMDYTWQSGWCGLRATCTSAATSFVIEADPDLRVRTGPEACHAKAVPDASLPAPEVLGQIDCSELGKLSKTVRHNAAVTPGAFARADAVQLMVDLFDAPDGSTHALLDVEGNVLWKTQLPAVGRMLPTPPRDDGGRDFYAIGREKLLRVDGRTGEILDSAPTPAGSNGKQPSVGNGPLITADLDGSGRADHFFLTFGANSEEIITIGPDLQVRWRLEAVSGNGHGHHNAVCDVDGDGREEIFAGCLLLDADGKEIWRQDEILRRLKVPNGGHVDSSVMGFFAGPDAPPTLHMASSSAGHLVCDAATGEMLAPHPQGHCQSVSAGRIVPGSDHVHAVTGNRWGSYGIAGVYAPTGRRVSRFQPGFVCQRAVPVNWTAAGFEQLLVVDGPGWRGIYDHQGNRLVDLDPLVPYDDPFAQRYDRVQAFRAPLVPGDPRDTIVLRCREMLRLIRPAGPCPETNTYRPRRRTNISWPQ